MRAVVVVAYRPGLPMRDRIWAELCKPQWRDWELVAADAPGDSFCIGHSRNLGCEQAGDWDVVLFADADILFGDVATAAAACELAYAENKYVVPHDQLHFTGRNGTLRLLNGKPLDHRCEAEPAVRSWIGSYAVSRELWERVRGFDPRFTSYAGEDIAFWAACKVLGGTQQMDGMARIDGDIWHLWHGGWHSKWGEAEYEAMQALGGRYRHAGELDDWDEAARVMRAIIEERDQ